jgi:hypothetical protein
MDLRAPAQHSSPAPALLTRVGRLAGGGFRVVAALRQGKPIHPVGVVARARVVRYGTPDAQRWGSTWLDLPGEHEGLVRFSRSVGLPSALPDVLGLALRLEPSGPAAHPHDLLLAGSRPEPGLRHLPAPSWDALGAFYGSLLPYRAGSHDVLLAAEPVMPSGGPRPTAGSPDEVAAVLEAGAVRFRLLVSGPLGSWHPVGHLDLQRADDDRLDLPLRFDPVRNPLPDLAPTAAHAALRRPAYADARTVPVPGQQPDALAATLDPLVA